MSVSHNPVVTACALPTRDHPSLGPTAATPLPHTEPHQRDDETLREL